MIKGIIFDLDGVIVTTDHLHYLAWKKIADKEHIYFDEKINNQLRGVSRMASLDIILKNASKIYSKEEKIKLAEEKNKIYVKSLSALDRSFLLNNVLETLIILKKKNIKLAVGSSSKNTRRILIQLKLIDYFDVIVDGTMIKNPKPDPEVFLKAKDLLGVKTNEVLVVEDAYAGIDAANAGKMASCGINGADDYIKATYKLKDISELLNLI